MASTWVDHLGLSQLSAQSWRIGIYGYKLLGSIYDLVPEEKLYDDAGELVIPKEWDGHKVRGLADGEYLESEELETGDYVDFSSGQIESARAFCVDRGWDTVPGFELAWLRVLSQGK
jgi:hypothetical protein